MPTRLKKSTRATKAKLIVVGLVAVSGIALALTNPGQAAYDEFATQKITDFVLQDVCQTPQSGALPDILGSVLSEGCRAIATSRRAEIKSFVANNTQRQNFILFSLYTTELPTRSVKTVGIFNQFFIYQIN